MKDRNLARLIVGGLGAAMAALAVTLGVAVNQDDGPRSSFYAQEQAHPQAPVAPQAPPARVRVKVLGVAANEQASGQLVFVVQAPTGAVVSCRMDLGAWVPCRSPWTKHDIPDGLHTLSARAEFDNLTNEAGATVEIVPPTPADGTT